MNKPLAPLQPLSRLSTSLFESPPLLRKLSTASRALAELKGIVASIPNESILINTLGLQEAKDSSEIENIVTTHDELYRANDAALMEEFSTASKEVRHYAAALRVGFERVLATGLLTCNDTITIQAELEKNNAGFRKLPGTALKNSRGETIYTPPQHPNDIVDLMHDLERFINDDAAFDADPLIKMAIIHHQFESIHPFYDGNGRTGRMINVLYLVQQKLLHIPVLYLSRHIVRNKPAYYGHLQAVRESDDGAMEWQSWVSHMLDGVEATALETIQTVRAIAHAMDDYKQRVRASHKFYSQDLINNLFMHPYTKIEFIERDLHVSRLTATKYLDALTRSGFVRKHKVGRTNYYVNVALNTVLTQDNLL